MNDAKRIALVADRPGWAWHSMALGLQKYAPAWAECDVLFPGDMNVEAAELYDGVLQFSWSEANTRIAKSVALVASHACEHTPWKSVWNKRPPDDRDEDWRAAAASRISNSFSAAGRFPKFAGLICVTPQLHKVAVVHRGGSDLGVAYLPAGVDPDLWPETPLNRTGGPLVVGWCGQHELSKPDVKGYSHVLEPLMANFRNSSQVEFRINDRTPDMALTQGEMADWYRSLDLLLVTSVCEGTPMPALEAMCCGRPVLGTSVGDLPHIVVTGMNGLLVGSYRDRQSADSVVDQLAWHLKAWAANREAAAYFGRKAAETIRAERHWRELAPAWLSHVLSPSRTSTRF